MLKSYFITGFRSILRNLVPSSINLVGLSVAMACAITLFILIDSFYDLDTMHEKGDRLHLLMDKVKGGDETNNWAPTPYLLGPALKQEHSAVESTVRVFRQGGFSVRHEDLVFSESIWFVDNYFFDVFSFTLRQGDKTVLRDKNNIVITAEMAEKYFGDTDPLGQQLSIKFSEEKKEVFTVAAVADRIPNNSSMFFNFLLSIEKLEDLKLLDTKVWTSFTNSTFVLLHEGHMPAELNGALEKYRRIQNQANERWKIQEFEMIPLYQVAERSYDIERSLSWSNHPSAMIAFGIIGFFLVSLACFNYMNVAVASVSTRVREIGIRKVIGGGRKEIIQQFLVENIVLCMLALLVGAALSYALLIPGFNALYPVKVSFGFSSTLTMAGFFGGLLLFVALVSGAYPALYVSSFNPVEILKRKEKFGNKSLLSKILLSLQFILSFTTTIACLVLTSSSYYFEEKDWGYSHAQNLVVPLPGKDIFDALRDRVAQHKEVLSYAGAGSQVGYQNLLTTIQLQEKSYNVTQFPIGFGYLETMGIPLKEGRSFDEKIESDKSESVVVNRAFVKKMGWTQALGQSFEFEKVKRYVIGVTEDFFFNDFFLDVDPVVFFITPPDHFRYIVVKAEAGSVNEVADFLKASWKAVAPDDPYRGFYQDDVFASFFQSNRANNKVIYFISAVAVLLAVMGLYGLVSYNLTRRLKEFSVRKIFGASMVHIFQLMNSDYMWIVLGSFGVGAALGSYLMNLMLLSVYPYPIPVSLWPYFSTITMMLFIVALTISTQLLRVAKENPTVTLRNE